MTNPAILKIDSGIRDQFLTVPETSTAPARACATMWTIAPGYYFDFDVACTFYALHAVVEHCLASAS